MFIKDDDSTMSKFAFGFLAIWCLAATYQGVYTFLLLYKKGRCKNWDLVIFYFYAMLTLVFAFIYFLDIIFDYSETLFDFFQSFIAYLFACAGISYLTNMILIILLDVGKHKWHMNQQQLNKMRWYVHWVTGLANCAVIVQFIVIFLINLDEDKKIKSPDHEKVMILYSINVFLICSVSLLQWWHFRYRIKSV
jgi:hypothetical protein